MVKQNIKEQLYENDEKVQQLLSLNDEMYRTTVEANEGFVQYTINLISSMYEDSMFRFSCVEKSAYESYIIDVDIRSEVNSDALSVFLERNIDVILKIIDIPFGKIRRKRKEALIGIAIRFNDKNNENVARQLFEYLNLDKDKKYEFTNEHVFSRIIFKNRETEQTDELLDFLNSIEAQLKTEGIVSKGFIEDNSSIKIMYSFTYEDCYYVLSVNVLEYFGYLIKSELKAITNKQVNNKEIKTEKNVNFSHVLFDFDVRIASEIELSEGINLKKMISDLWDDEGLYVTVSDGLWNGEMLET